MSKSIKVSESCQCQSCQCQSSQS